MTNNAFEAVIFDLDGVITKTAKTHSRAWKKMFDDYLIERSTKINEEFVEFTQHDYLTYVDGKPRYEGVKSFLNSRNIRIPFGKPDDIPTLETICGLGNRKNDAFINVLDKEGVEVYPSTVRLLEQLQKDNVRIGVASSSKNARLVLESAGLMHFIETRVDGVVSVEIGLNGKPAPDIFLTAAKNLGVDPNMSIVVEDAVSGVQAGKNGNFGLVLGLAREENNLALKTNGADIVVNDLEDISLIEINDWFLNGINEDNWKITYNDYDVKKEKSREALLTIGNGYFGTRGSFDEVSSCESNYPGTYIAGLYNRLTTKISGRDIENEDFVVAPNWTTINFKIDDEPWFNPSHVTINKITRTLDFRNGMLSKSMYITDNENRRTKVDSRRIANMLNPHQACVQYCITPLNYSGRISISSILDGTVKNEGVKRYSELNSQHLEPLCQGGEGNISWLKVKTNQSNIEIFESAKLVVRNRDEINDNSYGIAADDGIIYTYVDFDAVENETITIDKIVTIYDNNNIEGDIKNISLTELKEIESFDQVLVESTSAWNQIWGKTDIKLTGDRISQKMLRLHIYHLMVSASPHNKSIDAGITARGLHGEAYRGHIFWDELFILPFYDIHFPETAKSMLMYRYRRLNKAREYAAEYGYKGAMYPWQSGSDGREETQIIHINPVSGEWGDDYSSLQRHVSLSIAYNIWHYYNITNDTKFIESAGAEMFLEICRFWESKTKYNNETNRYSIDKVMGPDEFHESYPDSDEGGLRDNAYTNIMTAWMISKSQQIYDLLDANAKVALVNKISFDESELEKWKDIQSKLNLVINDESIISQYDGYFDLKELNWEYYKERYHDIHRMDRILKSEGKSADDYKVAKQADTLMTYYNLENDEITEILNNLQYELPEDYLKSNLKYYLQRTSHGSTLSRVVHSQLANIIDDKNLSWELYKEALTSDYNDIQGGSTSEGIHAGVMAGTIMIAISSYGGVDLRGKLLRINPKLPANWKDISFSLTFKKVTYSFNIKDSSIEVTSDSDSEVIIFDKEIKIKKNTRNIVNRKIN
jgi:beta-phosphoglucomutase family hydrolase